MKIGIVGGNSRVGTELSVLLNERDHEPVAIVRNQIAAEFFKSFGIESRVSDIAAEGAATTALRDLDSVVIAARADVEWNPPRQAETINEKLVRHSVRHSPSDASIIFLSSIAAHGSEVYGEVPVPKIYTREKRRGESILRTECDKTGKPGYGLRLGHVMGPLQMWTNSLKEKLKNRDVVNVPAKADSKSNILHTITLCDAILSCASGSIDPGTYDCVNRPQWTWEKVIDHYLSDQQIAIFTPEPSDSGGFIPNGLFQALGDIEGYQRKALPVFEYLPDWVYFYAKQKFINTVSSDQLNDLSDRRSIDLEIFYLKPAPGDKVSDIPKTKTQLYHQRILDDYFR